VTALIPIVGISPAIRYALDLVERFAPSKLPILLAGPPGSGKDLFAQEIHRRSGRSGSFVDVDCAALPRDVADGLLFGFRRGIFTGAHESHVGLVEQSDRGTLFLDELLGLFPEAQRKLLRVLETAAVRPLGERTKRTIDLRVVAAVQERVGAALQAGSLRDDLYDRLRGVVIELPPLAERPEDSVPLAEAFAGRHGRALEHGAARTLLQYDWPGNVRGSALEPPGCARPSPWGSRAARARCHASTSNARGCWPSASASPPTPWCWLTTPAST